MSLEVRHKTDGRTVEIRHVYPDISGDGERILRQEEIAAILGKILSENVKKQALP
jgi:hypothetical protein